MANSHEGWDTELFVVPPNEDDLCNICCQVLKDAVETSCGHSFCDKCITGWLAQRQVCPQDQKPLTAAQCRPMVRDRRKILDMKVKCPWCANQMELRALTDHKRTKCQKRPADAEDDDDEKEEPAEEKHEEENEYVVELAVDDDQDQKKIAEERKQREEKNAEQRDALFAAQLQEEERQRGLSLGISVSGRQGPGSPSRSQRPQQPSVIRPQVQLVRPAEVIPEGGEPHVDDFNNNNGNNVVIEYYQADEVGEGLEGRPDKQRPGKNRQVVAAKRNGCCGCSDRCWCCMCCVLWILLIALGLAIWFWGPPNFASNLGI